MTQQTKYRQSQRQGPFTRRLGLLVSSDLFVISLYSILIILLGQKPDAPASTKYSLKRFGDDINENAISSSFVSTADRFVFKSNGVPFPGTYDHKVQHHLLHSN